MRSVGGLDPREQYILLGFRAGKSAHKIAEDLNMSTKRVKEKKAKALRKLQIFWGLHSTRAAELRFFKEYDRPPRLFH